MGITNQYLKIDAYIAFLVGLLIYIFPSQISDFIFQKESDGVHWHLLRCIGGQIFATFIFSWKFQNSTVINQSVCHFIRIIPSILILMLLFQAKSVTPELIEPRVLNFLKYLFFATIAVHVIFLTIAGWKTGSRLNQTHPFGNFLCQLDGLASICIGACWMTLPKWLLHRQVLIELDESHELLGRIMGAMFIGSYIITTQALHWDEKDRFTAVEGRALCCIGILGGQLWSQTYSHWSGNHWVGISLFSTWTVISLAYRTYLVYSSKKERSD